MMNSNYGTNTPKKTAPSSTDQYYSSDVEHQPGGMYHHHRHHLHHQSATTSSSTNRKTVVIVGLLVLVAVLNAMGAGIMFIFSNTIMPTLGSSALDDEQGMTTMAAINVHIVNPAFVFVYFGGMIGLIPACLMWRSRTSDGAVADGSSIDPQLASYSQRAKYLAWAAFLIHFFGCVVITVSQNVPRNDELQRLVSEFGSGSSNNDDGDGRNGGREAVVSDEASDFWRNNYLTQWVAWNSARAAFGILSSIAAVLSSRYYAPVSSSSI